MGDNLAVEEPFSLPKLSRVLNPRPGDRKPPWSKMIPGIEKNARTARS
jgi:hypothetical protein